MYKPSTKFLVVDDFMMMRGMVKKILVEKGFVNILTAQNGSEAILAVQDAHKKNEPVDFIISDWNMPVMTGLEFLKLCRADEKFKHLPFLMVTAESEQSQILEAAKFGVTEYILKPFTPATLLQKIEKIYLKKSTAKEMS